MPEFIPGVQLSRLYYQQAVYPILQMRFPGLAHSAALIGFGSDVIGFDTEMSTDHMWGPRLVLFLPEQDFDLLKSDVNDALRNNLPYVFQGYPTHYGREDHEHVRWMESRQAGPVEHLIEIVTLRMYLCNYLGFDPLQEVGIRDWLTIEEHRLLAVTSGEVFHDDLGLTAVRSRLAYYPHDLWLYQMAAEWAKIDQEEPFVGRTGLVGDELGSRLIAARLVQYAMHLCFLMERCYRPYSKWFGTGFRRLSCAARLSPYLEKILTSDYWEDRQQRLAEVYHILAEMHNALGVSAPLHTETSLFYERPFLVIHAGEFSDALHNAIRDEGVLALPRRIGSVNQFIDSCDVLDNIELCRRMRTILIPD
jgi:hypothetical protein